MTLDWFRKPMLLSGSGPSGIYLFSSIQKLMSYDLFICFISYNSKISIQPVTISYNSKMQNNFFYPQLMMNSKTISKKEEQNDIVFYFYQPK